MGFIRIKNIKKNRYAYLVINKWRKRLKKGNKGSRQKVGKYLGKVFTFPKIGSVKIVDPDKYIKLTKKKIIKDLISTTLINHGFSMIKGKLCKNDLFFDINKFKFYDEKQKELNIVIEANEGFICNFTLSKLLNYKHTKDDERDRGIDLAKLFLEAGLNIGPELFVIYYDKI